ncbi:MAG: ACT domain-containing protein [Deltaproteobacteria bacterium]|nr:ACT domain-containing protein [Deltaproteobacteria bacterium]
MEKDRVFVVVIGQDQKGIIARVSTLLFDLQANIEDVQQKVMDGTFVMTLLADVSEASVDTGGLRQKLEELGRSLGLTIMVHHEAVLKAMHRV